MLGIFSRIFHPAVRFQQGMIQCDDAGIISFHPVHRPGSKAENNPEHTRPGVHVLVPDKGVVGCTHARHVGKEIVLVV